MKATCFSPLLLAILGLGGILMPDRSHAALPTTVDSDTYVYFVSPQFRTYFAVSGRLQLHLKPGSTTQYVGTYLDYATQKTLPTSVNATDAANPVLTLMTGNGKYVIKGDQNFGTSFYSGTATIVPPGAKSFGPGYFSASKHSSTAEVLSLVVTERVGKLPTPGIEITGTVTLSFDANNRVSGGTTSSTNLKGEVKTGKVLLGGYYSTSYTYFEAQLDGKPFVITGTVTPGTNGGSTTFNGYGITGTGATARIWVATGTISP